MSDIPIHREQCGEDALYFDVDAPDQLADTIARAWGALPDGHDPVAEATARSSMMGRPRFRTLAGDRLEGSRGRRAGTFGGSRDHALLVGLEADRAARRA